MPRRVNRYDAALHCGENVIHIFVRYDHLIVEVGIFHRDSCLARQRRKEVDVPGEVEIARSLWPDDDESAENFILEQREDDLAAKFLERSDGIRDVLARLTVNGVVTV